jgi:hypothetical protein
MAETESNSLQSQCRNRRLDNPPLRAAVAAWAQKHPMATARIHWTFTRTATRRKLRKRSPAIED